MLKDEHRSPQRPGSGGDAVRRFDVAPGAPAQGVAAGALAGRRMAKTLADGERRRRARYTRRAIQVWEVVVVVLVLLFVAWMALAYVLNRPHKLAFRAVCASNLRGIGQGLQIYAEGNRGALPQHYFELDPDAESAKLGRHGIDWIGAMGSHDWLKISQETSPALSPRRSHPSRSLFLLVTTGVAMPWQMLCPEKRETEDDLRNHGPDAGTPNGVATARPGIDRFDFRGYPYLSYAYQLPFVPRAALEKRDAREVVAADRGPYFDAGPPGLAGTQTTTDAPRDIAFPAAWGGMTADQLRKLDNRAWSRFNSRNHNGEGQNVLFLDGHADFMRRPTAGINDDNIYTFSRTPDDAASLLLGVRPQDAPLFGPTGQSDSYIVP